MFKISVINETTRMSESVAFIHAGFGFVGFGDYKYSAPNGAQEVHNGC